ncbi:MAG: cyclase [Sulfobacillus benefaciens]|uniref:Cyclase n=1 Tax=Sulfobacillus benefaciens TaxID=453960 RepID=A0A2T2WV19_9FIRM|nr:MAG: cyclase [Sulfobacillus benefaciens]
MFDNGSIIDLSLTLSEAQAPTWPGDVRFQTHVTSWFRNYEAFGITIPSRGPFQTHSIHMSDHTGTHCDAPAHFVPPPDSGLPHASPAGHMTVDMIPLTQYMGYAAVIDTRHAKASDQTNGTITSGMVAEFEERHGRLAPGEIVLFYSQWDRRYQGGGGYYGPLDIPPIEDTWNAPTVECIEFLIERGIKCIGTDGPSIGPANDAQPVHVAALDGGLGIVEGLANLNRLPPRGSYFIFLPLKLGGGTGGPGRALAYIANEGPGAM